MKTLTQFLVESKPVLKESLTLPSNIKNNINRQLDNITNRGNKFYNSIGACIRDVEFVLQKNGLEFSEGHGLDTHFSGMSVGKTLKGTFEIEAKGTGESYRNTMVMMSITKLSNRYELITYLS